MIIYKYLLLHKLNNWMNKNIIFRNFLKFVY